MLNISTALQIKSSTDNPISMASSGSASTKEPVTEEFGKVLEREVSEATSKRETNNTSSAPESSESTIPPEDASNNIAATAAPTAPTDISGATSIVANLFLDTAASAYKADQSLRSLDPASNPNTVTTISILPVTSVTLPQNPLIPQDNEQATGPTLLPVSQMTQQRSTQIASATSNFTYSPSNFWQSLGTADSAADGKFLPFSSEISEAIQINAGESIFSAPEESISAQSLSITSATSAASLNTATPQDVNVDLPVGQPKWGGEFAQKIVWLTTQQHQVAEIRLNPAHLGPVEVMLSITQDQATAQFSSPHLAVREAIEAALPRLREMMAENGIQLGNVMVGADSFQQENKQQQAHNSAKGATTLIGTSTETVGQIETTILPNRHNGIVNTYA